jgi:hypothetical protein
MRTRWFRCLGLVLVVGSVADAAYAAGSLFSSFDLTASAAKALHLDASYRALADSPATASLRLVRANTGLLNEKAASLTLDLEPGLELRAHRVDSYIAPTGSLVWSGILEDPTSVSALLSPIFRLDPLDSVMIVRNGEKITGNVHFNGDWYKIRPLRSGGHAIVRVDLSRMPPDHPVEYPNQVLTGSLPTRPTVQAKAGGGDPIGFGAVIRVMVHYTPAAATASGDINGLIDLAVAETNDGYTNSNVLISLVLVHRSQVTYVEDGGPYGFLVDLINYWHTNDGEMDGIHTTRNSVAADIGVLIIDDTQYCGLSPAVGSDASSAFSAVYWDCATGVYSFGHEIGHLLSADHDTDNDSAHPPFAYGHGYRYDGNPKWRTIMAYDCPGGGCYPRLNYWSNPNIRYNGVLPMGTTSTHDNARVLNTTKWTVYAYR